MHIDHCLLDYISNTSIGSTLCSLVIINDFQECNPKQLCPKFTPPFTRDSLAYLLADFSQKMEHFICKVIINEKRYDKLSDPIFWRVIRNTNAI